MDNPSEVFGSNFGTKPPDSQEMQRRLVSSQAAFIAALEQSKKDKEKEKRQKIESPCFGANPRAKHQQPFEMIGSQNEDQIKIIEFGKASESGRVNVNFTNLQQFVKFSKGNTPNDKKPMILVNSQVPSEDIFQPANDNDDLQNGGNVGVGLTSETVDHDLKPMFSFCDKPKDQQPVQQEDDELMFATAQQHNLSNE